MTGYKSLQVMDALNRINQQIKPEVVDSTIFANNTIAPNATSYAPLYTEQRDTLRTPDKDIIDYAQDSAVALGKGIVAVPQAAAGIVDIADAALSAIGVGLTGGNPADIQTGRFTKGLADVGVDFKTTQDIMSGWFSEGTQNQFQGLSAIPGMSTDKSLGENLSSLGQTAAYVAQNPSLAFNTIVESLPSIAAGGLVGRGAAAALGSNAGKAAGAIGEGTMMAGASQANMDRDAEGYTTAAQSLGALGIGILGGAVGQVGGRIANRAGADDIDSLAAGSTTTIPNKGFTSLAVGTATEAAEEAAQSSLENVIANVSSGKDAIEGLNQDLVLGTFAGAGMGAATNAGGSLKSAAFDAVMTAAQKHAERVKERITKEAPELTDTETNEFADPKSEKYNPTAAIIREAKAITAESTDEEVIVAKQKVDKVMNDAESNLAELQEMKELLGKEQVILNNIQGAQAAVANFAESEPERAAKAQSVLDNVLLPQLEKLNQVKETTDLEKVDSAIERAQGLVNEAREMHTKYSGLMNQAAGTQEQDQAQPLDAKIFGAPTAFTVEEINAAIADPAIPEQSKQALRVLADAIVAQNAVKSIDEVNGQIVGKKFDPQYRSTPQYMEQFSKAIKEKSLPAQQNLMREIQAFEQSHVSKAERVSTGLEQAKATGQSVQIIRNNGQWEVNTAAFLKGDEAKKNGAVTIHATPRGIAAMEKTNEYMQAEAQAIVSTRAAMQAMQQLNPTQQQPRQSAVIPQAVEAMDFTADVDPFQAALDGYNQDMRSANEWQPNTRGTDPRSTGVLEEAVNPTAGETVIPTEAQPTPGSAPTTNQSTGTPTATQSVETTATVKEPEAKSASVPEQSVSEATGTEGQTSTTTKPKTTKQQATEILEGKYSEDTHTVYQKEDGNWSVRKRDLQAELDAMNLELDNNVEAFEEVNVDEDGEASAIVTEADADEKVTEVSARDAERAKPINERNLIIDGFNRKEVPLVAVPNLHQYLDNPKRIKAVITKLTKVQPEQQHIDNVEQFMRFRNAFANHINGSVKVRRNIKPEHAKYNWQDYLQFLVQDDGTFDDATITALAATAYTWVAENGEVTTKTEKDVAKLLRLRNVENVPPHIYDAMAQLGDLRNVTITSLGQRTSQALGYKLVNDVSELRKAKLEAALGSLVLKGLEGLNLVEVTPVPAQDYANWKAEVEEANPGSRTGSLSGLSDDYIYNFVRIAQKDNEPSKGVKKIVEANKKTNGVLNKLFEVKSTFTMPLTEPPKEVKSTFNDAGTPIPSEAEDTIKASQVRPYAFITPMVKVTDVLRNLDAVVFKQMLGFKTENEVADMQVMKQKGQQSVNESIERSLDIFDSFRSDLNNSGLGERADFYMPQFLVSNTRSHYDSDLTPQMDKIHRGLVGMKEHEVELDISQELFTDKGITEMGRFIQALAMNMEEAPIYKNPLNNKYVTIDKANYKNFIPAFMAYIETPLVRNAIAAMQNVQSGKASHKDLTHIQHAVAEFGMNMQSLRALQALADFDTARKYAAQGSSSKFRTDLTFESDGVTNGPFLTGISTNTLADAARNAGGLFRDDKLTSVPEYKEGLGQDLYEFLGEAMKTAWTSVKAGVVEKNKKMAIQAINSLDTLYPAFGGRSGAKPITTTANYGAGDNSIKAANAREVINNLINKLDTNYISEALPFINAANDIIKYIDVIAKFKAKEEGKPHVAIPLIPTNANPKQIKLEPTQIKALFDYSKKMHGDAIEQALQIGMGDFIPVRNTLTNHASLAFEFFDVLRTDALEAATQRAIQEKTLETVNGKPIESISVKEKNRALREIAKYTPTFTNAMAAVSSNKAQSSTPLMKTDLTWEESYQATSELHFNGKSMKVHAHLRSPANPGVSGLALAIQSMDSFVTHYVMKRMASQNYHDANAGSIKDATKMAQLQNEGVFTALRTMHLSSGMVKAFLRSGNGAFDLGSLSTDGSIPSSIEEVLRKMVNAKKTQQLSEFDLASEIQQQVMSSFDRDIAKLRELAKEKYVGQYGTQEGHYTVTDADRKAIEKEVNKLKADRIRQLEEAGRLGKALNEMTGYKKPAKTAVSMEAIMQEGIVYHNLKGLLREELNQYTGESNTAAQQYSVLFKELMKMFDTAIPNDLVLKGINVNSTDADNIPNIQQVRENRISAWFGKDANGKDAIFFAEEAGMPTAKVVVHELLHAATVNAIAQFRANPDKYPEGKVALDRVEKLFNNVKKKVAKDKNASDIVKYGVQNLEEFIATGLTYSEFVDYLAKTQVQSGSRSKLKFTDGFAEFIKSVADVISTFVKSKVFQTGRMISALEALVYDTTDLIQNSVNTQKDLVPAPIQIDIFGAPQQARDTVANFTTKDVFESLDSNLDQDFKDHLASMMTHVSDTIYAGLDSSMLDNPDGSWSMEKAWQEYINEGKALTTETATTAGFRMTEQETFAVESLYTALVAGIKDKSMTQVYMEMDKAFKSARDKLKPSDFSADKQDGQEMHDFIFKLGSNNPEHLARFVAMAIGSQQFNGLLGFTARDNTAPSSNSFEKLVEATNGTLDYVAGLMTNSNSSQQVGNKVGLLAKELARIDAKNRAFAVSKIEKQVEKLADFTDGVSNAVRDRVVEFAEKDAIANSRFTAVRLASNVTRLSAKGDLWATLDVIKDGVTFDKPNEKLGFLGELVNEAANSDSTKSSFEKMLRLTKLNNQMKENLRDTTTKNVMSTFEENGSYLTKEDKQSLTLMLRSDVQVLDGTYSTADIAKLYSDNSFLNAERRGLEAQLLALDPKSQVMINRAKQLAKYMVTGLSSSGMAKNAQLIVSGFNSGEIVDVTDPRVDLVDKLATMYAITYTSPADKARLNNVMKRELKNKVNGVDTSIKFHKELAKTARDTLFTSNPTSVIKGYVPEITNPNREIRIAHNQQEEQLYKNQFYKEVKSLQKDKRDPNNNPKLFLTEEANIQRLVSGAVEVVSTNRKGTQVILDHKSQARITADIARSIPTSASYDPMNDSEVHMTPNYDTQGHVIGYSYEMSAANRDNLLERNNDFSELLGAYAATNFNKVTVPAQNKIVIDATYQDYKDNFSSNPRAYVNVGPNSPDQGLREIWAMLPEDTRKHIDKVWGKDGMQIRNDVLLMTFGYRKYSLNQSFDKMDEAKGMFEKLYTGIMKEMFGNNAKIRGVQGERAWQEAVLLMKDIIVIRNVKTMLFNTMSNGMLLMAHGISPTDIVKNTLLSVRAGLQYRKDAAQLMAIRQKQRAGIGDFNKLEQQALKIEDSLSRNPLASFIEEGMMPTIVEDVDPDTNHYSYKNKLQQRMEGLTAGVPKSVKTAAKWAFVSPDTPLYKFLNNATQFSDFSAKYTMYQYYTQKAKDKLSHDEALQIASDNFINYDVPTSRGLQYMNDMGAVMFTKYNIRIQKALFQLLKKRPATAMAQALFINSFTNLEAGIDPLVWFNLGNPVRDGAFGLPGALDEPLPVKIMSGLF